MNDANQTPDAVREAREYRKIATIKAVQWWQMGDHPAVREYDDIDGSGKLLAWVDTMEGGHIVTPGDWIATGVHGEHWPIKPDVFAATYEAVPTHVTDRTWPECLDPNAPHNRRHRLAALDSRAGEDVRPDSWSATPEEVRERAQLLADMELHLKSSRIFITTREKMHQCGVELHDELLGRVTAAIDSIGKAKGHD